ncbi:TIGR00266 family protein [Allorhodopirellula solitaria]|uniref:TIGR00266 family protein n=1 Tax=Allorhodopirellula solitaria TaxID=2527987 RepID=A0A5C5YKE8_9BACT|nr:TIGR00266 family protein [Allorhodopirellula solitaria]TWT75380.1 hypothetical protein CA85_06710 [Allorhodopirellula solitaria]
MISIACPHCQKRYRLDDKFAGKKAKCKGCGQVMSIKASPTADSTATLPSQDPLAANGPPAQNQPHTTPDDAAAVPPAETAAPITETTSTATPVSAVEPLAAGVPPAQGAATDNNFASVGSPGGQPGGAPHQPNREQASRGEASQILRGTTNHLQYEISQRPDFSIVKVEIPQGRKLYAEPSAMVSMTPSMHLEAGFKGGIGKTFGRLLGGESLIINTFTAQDGPGEVMFAGGAAGDVAYHRLEGNSLYLQRGAYMFNSEGVEVSGKWQGAKGFFSGEGLVLLKASGTGDIFFNSYGAIVPIDVTDGFIVDTGYVVAFEESLQYRVTVLPGLRTAGKIKSFFFGGEGLVCQFAGTGRVWVQTRQVKSFLSWAHNYRPAKSN